MGEAKRKLEKHREMLLSCAGVQTMAGEGEVRWETDSAATPMGQLAYFIEFLNLTGLWSRWLAGWPLSYSSPNAPAIGDVIGMWMLSILSGYRRYSHVRTIRGDGVNPVLLAMGTVVSADALRKGLLRIPEAARTNWLDGNLDESKAALEDCEQPYLFKLKLSKKVKRHISRLCDETDWAEAGQGWEGKAGQLALQGWNHKRRVIVLRRPQTREKVAQDDSGHLMLSFSKANRKRGKEITGYEYAVLVTNTRYEILTLGPLYRDRADAENAFDELKNPWGWGGYTTHDLHRCQLAARAVALIYNWWRLFVRLAHPEARREAITSRPWLMTFVGRKTDIAGQTTVTRTGLHAHFAQARAALTRVSALLQGWVAETAEPLTQPSVWHRVCDHLKRILAGIGTPPAHPLLKNHPNGVS